MTEATHPANGNGNGHGGDDPLQKRVAEGPRGGARTWYDVLEVAPDVSAADLKKAYDRALALVEGRSIGGYLMLDPLAAESARADVEAAYSVLGDVDRRRAYDAKLRDSGEEPVSHTPTATSHTSPPSPASPVPTAPTAPTAPTSTTATESDDEARHARELLAIEAGQKKSSQGSDAKALSSTPSTSTTPPTSTTPSTSTTSPPSLKFTAPAEPSEEALPSPGRPSTPPRATSAPVANAQDPFTPIPTRRIFVAEPVEDAMAATATIPPEAAMPSPRDTSIPTVVVVSPSTSTSTSPSLAPPAAPPTTGGLPDSGEIPGALIRSLREARGLTLDDMASATKIRKPYLRAIEEEDHPNLPARVYLRGFLTQIARMLKVDRQRLADGYLLTAERLSKG